MTEEIKEVKDIEEDLVIESEEAMSVTEGRHVGRVKDVVIAENKGYKYADFRIELSDEEAELKWGAPLYLTKNSKLGKFMDLFTEWTPGDKVSLREAVGKKVSFVVVREQTDRGLFYRIQDGSIKRFVGDQ